MMQKQKQTALAERSDVPWPSLPWERPEAERQMQQSAQQREEPMTVSLSSLVGQGCARQKVL